MRLRLDLGYDGSGFHGWAAQTGLRTVQGELELWIQRVLRLPERPELVVAGRTDAGVHARGQVAHLDLSRADAAAALSGGRSRATPEMTGEVGEEVASLMLRRLRRSLPEDVQVFGVRPAEPGFDARFSAIWRRYVYRLTDTVPDPILRNQVAAVRAPLDVEAINAAGAALLGLHDFAAFCRAREGATTVRELQCLRTERVDAGHIEITVRADAFCHSMVRSLVGALVEVGAGRRDAAWLPSLLDAGQRSGDVPVMPARGLVLEEVGYPSSDRLASRAAEARARRELPGGGQPQPSRASAQDWPSDLEAGPQREEDR
ncbi:MAG: tRNA pseudouridine(38-40) synthase TruA [Propionibacteriaceae bacterium]|nr:tRNA pseudouridine(38-40) synthase TruA [Propionibacteriaceae bacterium]